jgi:hypothetical protein
MGAGLMDEKLEQFLKLWKNKPFKWGRVDCCQFAADAMLSLHGHPVLLPKYQTERAAIRAIQALGGYGPAMQNAGLKQRPSALQAMRGDVVVVRHRAGGYFPDALAICTGDKAHTTGPHGLVDIHQRDWLSAWGVA